MNYDFLIESRIYSLAVAAVGDVHDVIISIVGNDETRWLLIAYGVTDLVANEFRLQNIIDRIRVTDSLTAEEAETRKEIFRLLRGRPAAGGEDLNWIGVDKVVDGIKASELVLLEIEAVYGVTLCLIARRISLEKDTKSTDKGSGSS